MIEGVTRFAFPTTILFGPGARRDLPACVAETGMSRPLIVTDPGLRASGLVDDIQAVLDDAGVPYAVFDQVQANPLVSDVEAAGEAYRTHGCDGVIGLGGGSSLDAAKVVPVEVTQEGSLVQFNVQTGGNQGIRGPLPPMIAIPTTAGTGSEVGRCAVITAPQLGRKFLVCHPLMMPARAILDPELTVGLPPALTAATGMDAFTHNIEALTAPVFHPMCDAIALKGIEFVVKYLECAVSEPTDLEARGYMMLAAMMGAVAFQKDLGAAHSLAHPLSTECGVQHGLANAICLVPVMRYNREVSAAQYAQVARCFGVEGSGLSDLEAADRAIQAVADLDARIGIPRSLDQVGVREEQLPALADKAFEDPCHLTNPRPCTREDLLALYREAYRG